jgi:hypothetical protein
MAEDLKANSAPPPMTLGQWWARATMWIVIVLIVAASGVYIFKGCLNMPGRSIQQVGQALADVAAAFNRGTITTSFVSYGTSLSNYHRLQLATLKQTEIFTRTEETSTAFGYIPLPDVVVEARAPVEYTYYLDFNAPWKFVLRDNVVHVFAPPIRFNKPAVDASAITYEVRKGHLKTAEAQENLKRSITSLVTIRAKENIPLVRENARKQTSEFVEKWLLKTFTDGKNYPVKVYFSDETSPTNGPGIFPRPPSG